MLPDATWNCGTLVFADKIETIAMQDTHFWDALQANLTQSINEGVDSRTMPDDGAVREGDPHTFRGVLYVLCGP